MESVGGQVKGLVLRADDDATARAEHPTDLGEIGGWPREKLDHVPEDDDVEEVVGEGQARGLGAFRAAERDVQPAPLSRLHGFSRDLNAEGVPAACPGQLDELAGAAPD